MILLILFRLIDIITTLVLVNRWGIEVEGNPLVRKTLENGLFFPYQLIYIGVIIILAERIAKYRRVIYLTACVISLVAIINNTFCLLFIR